ncbi:MAG: flagellar FlbD family protein [Firmicutes bacterium]|nr:flagellar FlbD family protein [Bacillota bacterium]
MIKLSRLNRTELVLNAELIEIVEATPDTVITLSNGHRLVVRESIDEVIERVIDYQRKAHIPMVSRRVDLEANGR